MKAARQAEPSRIRAGWSREATRTLPDVDLATEPVVQHKAVIRYQKLEGKGAGVGHLGQVHLSSGIRDLGEGVSK